jgi:hypothetical protein
VSWTPAATFAIEDANGIAYSGGVVSVPANTSSVELYLHKLSGTSVTVPLTATGSFGTWRTLVGGGSSAW